MKIISWNVNGLRAVLNKGFEDFIKEQNPDIICLQETKVYESVLPAKAGSWYENYLFNHASKKGYSGTAFFSKVKPIKVHCVAIDPQIQEGRVICAEFEDFYLINVYTPNSKSELARLDYRQKTWDKNFCNYLQAIQKEKPIIVCGDLNVAHEEIDLANPQQNHFSAGFTDEEREGFSNYLSLGLLDIFRELHPGEPRHYTWWSYRAKAREKNVGWRIDYFLISKALKKMVKNCKILKEVHGSDHAPILLELK